MDTLGKAATQNRNRAFDESHRTMIETAVRLISEKGADALSIAGVAREMGIDRTTVYYHFESRDALLRAVSSWATEQLDKGMDLSVSELDRTRQISQFVVENPALIKLWIDRFVSGTDIRDCYSRWDELVAGVRQHFARERPDEQVDAEVYCVMLLCASIIGPRVFANSVEPGASADRVIERFFREEQRMLNRDGLLTGAAQPADREEG
ncbi:MAG: helix-turn-helix domain-containing protein [Novosphingobium sp.]